ncbi:MAG TPA: hypothetical protein VFA98_13075 [Thermoanaerobaculia bacterium]|jgi:hypothetical protein|nr:hypothetical protein [Thermoanaerobaculia bacterium]
MKRRHLAKWDLEGRLARGDFKRPVRMSRSERARLGIKRRVVSDTFLDKISRTFKSLLPKRRARHAKGR